MDAAQAAEWEALQAEHERLKAELAWLRGQMRPNRREHDALIRQLQEHEQRLVA
jgi:hypothetical protein